MQNAMNEFMLRVITLFTGACIGLGVAIAASFGTFEMIVTVLLSMITWLLANYLGD